MILYLLESRAKKVPAAAVIPYGGALLVFTERKVWLDGLRSYKLNQKEINLFIKP